MTSPGAGVAFGLCTSHRLVAPWHFLNFLPLPHGQGSLRPTSR